MRKYQVLLACMTVLAMLSMVMLTGCPTQEEPDMVVDPFAEETIGNGMVEDPQTVSDIMGAWPSSFVMHIEFEDKETGETESATMTMMMGADGPSKMRMEMPEEAGVFILDHQEMMMYSWDEASGQGMMMSLAGVEEDAGMEGVANPYGEVDPETTIVGDEVVDGVDCWVAEYTAEGEEARIWYSKENGLVQRIETDTMVANYSYSDVGTVSEDAFEVPEGIEMMDLSDLGDLGGLELE